MVEHLPVMCEALRVLPDRGGTGRHRGLSTRGYGPSLKEADSAGWMGFELGALLCNVTASG